MVKSRNGRVRLIPPSGCRWCGIERLEHMQRWAELVGWHKWEEPTLDQRKERILARRALRGDATGRGASTS